MDMQQQDRFIFVKTMEQWENNTLMDMKQWVTSNKQYIKYCLGVGLKQEKLHRLDIWKYMPDTSEDNGRKLKYKRKEKKSSRIKNKKGDDK
eukprot:14041458-Ditylum_brightwellii.AAC.1